MQPDGRPFTLSASLIRSVTVRSNAERFYQDGIRFECQGSGGCCRARGLYGYLYLTLEDRRRLAAHLSLSTRVFTEQYCERPEGRWHLRHPERDCRFLQGGRCAVYEARPAQCRTWPFWPQNMNPRVWYREVVPTCPGVGRGRLYSAEEIEALLAARAGS
jgi:Fe-S-cluster containining protein